MRKKSDLTPPLGHPGGPCHVVRRIQESVPAPRVRDRLDDKVEVGDPLTNPEANVIYSPLAMRGPGWIFRTITITPHAQYRMDLRGVWISEIKIAIEQFMSYLLKLKNKGDSQYESILRDMKTEGYNYQDSRTQLSIVVAWDGRDGARVVTVYFKGDPDPKAPGLDACAIKVAALWLQRNEK